MLEVSLGLARNHGSEVKDDVWAGRQQTVCGLGDSEVGGNRLDVQGRRRPLRLDNVGQHELLDGGGPERAVAPETLDKPATEHPGSTEDQDAHARTVMPSRPEGRRHTVSPVPLSRRPGQS